MSNLAIVQTAGAIHSALVRGFLTAMIALATLSLAASAPLSAQQAAETRTAGPRVLAYTFEHQPASEALTLVRELLSPMGTVELQLGGNTLVMRDHDAVLRRVETALERFDHRPKALRFEIHLLRASNRPGRGGAPDEVTRRLREHLKFEHYDLLAHAGVSAQEGEDVTYALGSRFGVSFRSGAMVEEDLKLHRFRIVQKPPLTASSTNKSRQPEPRELIQTDINLRQEKQFTLVLSQGQGNGQALAVVIIFRPDEPASRR